MIDIKDKPKSLPLIDFFIKKTAIKTLVREDWAEIIIKDQFRSLHDVAKKNFDIEITGIGTLKISKNLANTIIKKKTKVKESLIKNIEKVEDGPKKDHLIKQLESVEESILSYKSKVALYEDRFQGTTGGNSEQASRSEMEEGDSSEEI